MRDSRKQRMALVRMVRMVRMALLVVILPGLISACSRQPEAAAPAPATASANVPEQQLFDYRMIESEAGVKLWILQSAEMQKFPGQRDMILGDVHMDFFREGEHFSVLDADSGRVNIQTRNVETWGNVIVVTDDGRRLETEKLLFDNETGLIHNDVFNRFTRATDVMTGIGLEATPDLEYIELKRDVKAEVDDSSDLTGPEANRSESESGSQ